MLHCLRNGRAQASGTWHRFWPGAKTAVAGVLSGLLLAATPALAQSGRYEAENAQVFGGATVGSGWTGYSGSGFTENLTNVGASTKFTVTAPIDGEYYVTLRYATGGWGGSQKMSVYVNGVDVKPTDLPSTGNWNDWASKKEVLTLTAGTNSIEYRYDSDDSGWINLDYIWLTKRAGNGAISQPITTGDQLVVSKFVKVPTGSGATGSLISMASYDNHLLVADHPSGIIYEIVDAPGTTLGKSTQVFFNVQQAVDARNADTEFYVGNAHGGLRGVAFPPGFTNPSSPFYRKFYTSVMERNKQPGFVEANHNYLYGYDPGNKTDFDGVLLEWSYDPSAPQGYKYREVLRVGMPVFDHPMKDIAFNPYAQPGDEDYGLLYVAHGDGSNQEATEGNCGQGDNGLGKILRINPLQSGSAIAPHSNPFYNNPNWHTKEVYARGFRNPHTFSFTKDASGATRLLVGDAGRGNVEEVNLVAKGGNYGWPLREGNFEHFQVLAGGRAIEGVSPLPALAPTLHYEFEYPAAQWAHNVTAGNTTTGQSGVSGYAFTNPTDGQKYFMYADFVGSGRIFYSDLEEMVGTTRQLSYGQAPEDLTQAQTKEFSILFDDDNDRTTAAKHMYSFSEVVSNTLNAFQGRTDLRFGQGPNGDLYILTKRDGWIYKIDRVVPASGPTNTYEAEDAIVTGPATVGTQWQSYRAQGFVEYMNSNSGASVYYDNVEVASTGMYLIDLRYAAQNGGNLHLYVNGVNKGLQTYAPTGDWNTWYNKAAAVYLQAGRNTIQYRVDNGDVGNINLDYIQVRPNTYEAEDAEYYAPAIAANYFANYRGSGFVENLTAEGTFVKFHVTVPAGGTYDVDLRYAAAITNSTRSMSLYVNDVDVMQAQFPATNDWNVWANQTARLTLNPGENTIMYRFDAGDYGWINADYLRIRDVCNSSFGLTSAMQSSTACRAIYRVSVANANNTAGNYQWYIDGVHDTNYDGANFYDVTLTPSNSTVSVSVRASSACNGALISAQHLLSRSFRPGICREAVTAAYPNPADTYLQVLVPADESEAQPGTNTQGRAAQPPQPEQPVHAELFNQYGALVRSASGSTARPPQLDTSTLPEGFYHVVITQPGKALEKRNIQVKH